MPRWPQQSIVICDTNLLPQVKRLFTHFPIIVLPSGEQYKRLSTVEWVCNELIKLGGDRQTVLIGVGGGVVGDMVGLIASVFMRGIQFYLLPTTLLAMVDSSIGGKTGVDLAAGKNLIGTFYQPQAVVVEPSFLKTLPRTEFSNGMAEVIKHGVLHRPLFLWVEKKVPQIKKRHSTVLAQLVKQNVVIKKTIVQQDTYEQNKRMLLNLGHTFAHAFEQLSDYQLPHGQAVAIGLAYASAYGQMPERNRLLALLNEFDLPTSLIKPFSAQAIVHAMLADKKHQGDTITLVVPRRLGAVHIHRGIKPSVIERFIRQYHEAN